MTHTRKLSDIDPLTVKTVPETPVVPAALNGHECVDLGLPSGTLWATCNLGAASPADCGDYFAWGEAATKAIYNWDTYVWYKGDRGIVGYSKQDNKVGLGAADDAVTANWGSAWRMPTFEEIQELLNEEHCTWTWVARTNSKGEPINGYEVKSKANGNSIFLPAAGYRYGSSLFDACCGGYYWASSLYLSYPYGAYCLAFGPEERNWDWYGRGIGHPVRAVRTSVLC